MRKLTGGVAVLQRIKNILTFKKDIESEKEIIKGFLSSKEDLRRQREEIKKNCDEFEAVYKQQVLNNSLQIQKGNSQGSFIDNLKFLADKKRKVESEFVNELSLVIETEKELDENFHSWFSSIRKGKDFNYKSYLQMGLGKDRSDMPQIDEKDLDSFILHFQGKSKGAKVTKTKIKLSKIKPSQQDFSEDKIISGLGDDIWKTRNYIISKDDYLLDGHHSWASGLETNPEEEVSVYKVNLPIKELLRRTNLLSISYKKDAEDNFVKSLLVDFIESKEEYIEFLQDQKVCMDQDGFNKVREGKELVADDFLVKSIEGLPVTSDFTHQVKFLILDGSTHCLNFYTADIIKGKEIKADLTELIDEHKQLVKVLDSPSKEDDKVESEKQKEELEGYEAQAAEDVNSKSYADMLLIRGDGKFLLLNRAKTDEIGAEQYCLPGGGIEEGEEPRAAVLREIGEETGMIDKTTFDQMEFLETFKNGKKSKTYYFLTKIEFNPTITLDSEEHFNYIWVNKQEYLDLNLIFDLKDRLTSIFEKL